MHTFASLCLKLPGWEFGDLRKRKHGRGASYEFLSPNYSKRKSISRRLFPVWTVLAVSLLLGCLAFLLYILIPGGLRPGLGRGDMTVCLEENRLALTWPQPIHADASRLYRYDLEKGEYVLYGEFEGNSTVMEGVRQNEEILLKLQAVRYTVNGMGQPCERTSRKKSIAVRPVLLERPNVQEELDLQEMALTVNWDSGTGNLYEVFCLDENNDWKSVRATGKDSIRLNLGGEIAMPKQEQPVSLAVRTMRRGKGCVYYSVLSEVLVVEWDDLAGTELALQSEEIGDRLYRLTWEETGGDTYEVQQWSAKEQEWEVKKVLDWTQERVYDTERLPSGAQVRFRVVAYRKADREGPEDFTAEPETLSFYTGISPLYCTVWPIVDLELLDSAGSGSFLAKIPAGEALCVLGEEEGSFQVRYRGMDGYVDSRYCMINLPEYLGDMCEYEIANSYSSIFRVHGYDIPGITGTVVKGYQNIRLGNDDFIVPYLYPCSQLLLQAAKDVAQDGYRLRIYDAFRPNEATRFLYNKMSTLLDQTVPGEGGALPTFGQVMMNNRYHLSSFLAATVSSHNRGIALDLTLVEADSGEEVAMQSQMHDLSWYSCLSENNEKADLLALYMKRLGFNGLESEWWHFQDDATRQAIGLNTYLTQGVAITGWKKDDTGWRYRLADGSYHQNTTVTIDGETCTFDGNGYVRD